MVHDVARATIAGIDARRRAEMDAGRARLIETASQLPGFDKTQFERQLRASDEAVRHDEEMRQMHLFGDPEPSLPVAPHEDADDSLDGLLASLEK